jgi:GT2 family glycosyltransferase
MRLENLSCRKLYYEGEFNFARMNNLGAREAQGNWLVFLNDDVTPLEPGWLTELARHVARTEVGVVGARLLYPSGAIQHAGMVTGMMGGVGHSHRDTFGSPYWRWPDLTRNISAVTGACLAIRRSLFEELGGMDEEFPVNFNDVDLCLRARARGYEVIYEPSAVLRHDESQTRTPGVRWRERQRWRAKWPDLGTGEDPFYSPHLRVDREDASLRLDEPLSPEDNSR